MRLVGCRVSQPFALTADRASKRYGRGRTLALDHVDLQLPVGTVTALVGPNGAGKSTLIRSWMGFERLSSGAVTVDGIDVRRDRSAAVRRTGYVPQSVSLYRGLTVDDHLVFAAAQRSGFDADHARDRAARVGIDPSRRLKELSGGQQAQVALAIALGTRAPILILDEPLASLDPLARRGFLGVLLEDVRERGSTAVLSTHVVTDVEQACDRLVVLTNGRVALHAAITEARASHRVTPAADWGDRPAVGRIDEPDGQTLVLVRSDDEALAKASLEQIVLGYLAAAQGGVR